MKKTSWPLSAVLGGIVAAVSLAPAPSAAQQAITIGTSSIGSTFYVISVAMSKMITSHAGINVTVQPLGGSYANLFGLAGGRVDFAIANSLSQQDSYYGRKPFKKASDVRIVAQGQPNYRALIVRNEAGIERADQLVGRTIVAKRRALPALEKISNALIKVYGLPKDKMNLIATVNTGQVVKALRAGTVDAAFYPVGPKQPALSGLYHDGIAHFFPLAREKRDEMLKHLPSAFWGGEMAAGSFPGQKETAHLFELNTTLVTSVRTSEETVYRVVKSILGNHEEFSKFHAAARQWTPQNSLKNPSVPLHPGAIRYYKEIGVWTAEMDSKQAALLKR